MIAMHRLLLIFFLFKGLIVLYSWGLNYTKMLMYCQVGINKSKNTILSLDVNVYLDQVYMFSLYSYNASSCIRSI